MAPRQKITSLAQLTTQLEERLVEVLNHCRICSWIIAGEWTSPTCFTKSWKELSAHLGLKPLEVKRLRKVRDFVGKKQIDDQTIPPSFSKSTWVSFLFPVVFSRFQRLTGPKLVQCKLHISARLLRPQRRPSRPRRRRLPRKLRRLRRLRTAGPGIGEMRVLLSVTGFVVKKTLRTVSLIEWLGGFWAFGHLRLGGCEEAEGRLVPWKRCVWLDVAYSYNLNGSICDGHGFSYNPTIWIRFPGKQCKGRSRKSWKHQRLRPNLGTWHNKYREKTLGILWTIFWQLMALWHRA